MIDVETIFDSDREEYEFMQEKKEQQMKETELKPCPFCGSKNINLTEYDEVIVFVQCDDCWATFPHFDTKEEAINAWNRRATDERAD